MFDRFVQDKRRRRPLLVAALVAAGLAECCAIAGFMIASLWHVDEVEAPVPLARRRVVHPEHDGRGAVERAGLRPLTRNGGRARESASVRRARRDQGRNDREERASPHAIDAPNATSSSRSTDRWQCPSSSQ